MNAPLTERHSQYIKEVISCFDRIVIRRSFEKICYARAMEATLSITLKWSPFCSQSFLGFIVSDLLGLQAE
jgi:hypothetical protein